MASESALNFSVYDHKDPGLLGGTLFMTEEMETVKPKLFNIN